jgi:hypothetical protein
VGVRILLPVRKNPILLWTLPIFTVNGTIQVNALLDICENNIPFGKRRVFQLGDIDDFDKCTTGKADLIGHRSYGVKYSKYLFVQILLMHEQMHMFDFKEKMLQMLPILIQRLSGVQNKPCEAFRDFETAQKEGQKMVKNAVDHFLRVGKKQLGCQEEVRTRNPPLRNNSSFD